jgi:hypothetical protein
MVANSRIMGEAEGSIMAIIITAHMAKIKARSKPIQTGIVGS